MLYKEILYDKINEGYYSHEDILNELMCFLPEETIKDFCLNSFGNVGILNEE